MIRSLDLVDVGPSPHLHLDLGSRFNVMTGDNGLGKSFVLDVIWWALSGTWAGPQAWPREGAATPKIEVMLDKSIAAKGGLKETYVSSFDVRRQEWNPRSFDAVRSPLPALVFYARADGGFAVWDPVRNHFSFRPGSRMAISDSEVQADPATIRRPPAYLLTFDEALNEKKLAGKTICNGLISDWVSWQLMRPETPSGQAFQRLCAMLETLSPNPENDRELIRPGAPRRVFVDDSRMFPTINMGYGDVPIIHASAGMRRIVSLAYMIVWTWHEHLEASRLLHQAPADSFVFLMDEVETHLHPEWQRRIVPAILTVLEALSPSMKVQLHLTTHAPLVLASLETRFDPDQDKLFVFDLESGAVVLDEIPWARRGDASRWLTSPAFNLHRARSIEAERAIDDANAFMRGEEPKHHKTHEAIERALSSALSDQDPFWPRWLTFKGDTAA
ncbi:MAG: AAA family ATPase [Byssovorax sp.]